MDDCVCGAVITTDDDLCDDCLTYCAKAIGVEPDTFYDAHGQCQYFDVLRFAWDHTEDLRMNKSNTYWTADDTIGDAARDFDDLA